MAKHSNLITALVAIIFMLIVICGILYFSSQPTQTNQNQCQTSYNEGYNQCVSEYASNLTSCENANVNLTGQNTAVNKSLQDCLNNLTSSKTPIIQQVGGVDLTEIVNTSVTYHITTVTTISFALSLVITLFSFKIDINIDTKDRWLLFLFSFILILVFIISANWVGIHFTYNGIPIV